MKTLTKKQRREIYLKVEKNIFNEVGESYLCGQLADEMRPYGYNLFLYQVENKSHPEFRLPEFDLFQPNYYRTLWFPEGDKKSRINCMLFCAEMCKP